MSDTYDRRTIVLHWASALLVFGLWTVGQCIDFFPKGMPRITVRSLHITLGVLLGLLLLRRILWRRGGGTQLPPADAGLPGRAAVGMHHLLYALMGTTVLIGLACVWIRGDNLFGLFTVPAFDPTNKDLREQAVDLHELAANALLLLALAHGAMAAWHHRVLKDGVLRRMWPSLPPSQR